MLGFPGAFRLNATVPVVDLDAALGEQLFDVAVRQAEAQVPTDGQDDHVGWEAEPSERRTAGGEQSEGGGFSCWQSCCWNAVIANATAPAGVTRHSIYL